MVLVLIDVRRDGAAVVVDEKKKQGRRGAAHYEEKRRWCRWCWLQMMKTNEKRWSMMMMVMLWRERRGEGSAVDDRDHERGAEVGEAERCRWWRWGRSAEAKERDGDGEVNELCQHEEKKKKSRDSHREGPKIIPKMALRWVIFITNENLIIKIILIKLYQKNLQPQLFFFL